jgi:hypothetical protein
MLSGAGTDSCDAAASCPGAGKSIGSNDSTVVGSSAITGEAKTVNASNNWQTLKVIRFM